MEGKYLVNCDQWFVGPDGQDYKAVWGEVEVLKDDFLGIKTNRISTNWFLKVGTEDDHVIVAGCQVHYATKCDKRPDGGRSVYWNTTSDGGHSENTRPCLIYFADGSSKVKLC